MQFLTEQPGHNMLWHYIGSFTFYTLVMVGLIYAAYFYLKHHPQAAQTVRHTASARSNPLTGKVQPHMVQHQNYSTATALKQNTAWPELIWQWLTKAKHNGTSAETHEQALVLEQSLPLDNLNALHVVQVGTERMLVSSHPDKGVEIISLLEPGTSQTNQTPDEHQSLVPIAPVTQLPFSKTSRSPLPCSRS